MLLAGGFVCQKYSPVAGAQEPYTQKRRFLQFFIKVGFRTALCAGSGRGGNLAEGVALSLQDAHHPKA